MTVAEKAKAAAGAAKKTPRLSGVERSRALEAIARKLVSAQTLIVEANQVDLTEAHRIGVAAPLVKRLRFDEKKISQTVAGVRAVASIPDLVGRTQVARELDEGLILYRKSSPIGVLAMVFESRPDALVQIASLALKSANGLILKGGSEARNTNRILADLIAEATVRAGLPEGWIQLLETREEIGELLSLDEYVDLIIPRGSNAFVRHVMDNTRIPVLGHADGICHVYIDTAADPEMATRVAVDSKTQYVAVCNAAETLLIHSDSAPLILPELSTALIEKGVELRGCERARQFVPEMIAATDEDWSAEYLDLILAIRVVDSLEEAVTHINTYGSKHTDAIVTPERNRAEEFMNSVDSASVMWNASTRFADGFRYGLGAEVGISTGKIHARGPVGVEGLLSYKWFLYGNGHVVADYDGEGGRTFSHKDLSIQ